MSDPDRVKDCPECKEAGKATTFEGERAAMRLGAHRRREHGIVGATAGKPHRRIKDRAPRPKAAPQSSLGADLKRSFKVIGTVVGVVDPYCGDVLIKHSGSFCDALARLAKEDPRIGRWLSALGKAGPYGALFVASAELAIPIAAHHGLIAPEAAVFVGVNPPTPRTSRRHPEPDFDPAATASAIVDLAIAEAEGNGSGVTPSVPDHGTGGDVL